MAERHWSIYDNLPDEPEQPVEELQADEEWAEELARLTVEEGVPQAQFPQNVERAGIRVAFGDGSDPIAVAAAITGNNPADLEHLRSMTPEQLRERIAEHVRKRRGA